MGIVFHGGTTYGIGRGVAQAQSLGGGDPLDGDLAKVVGLGGDAFYVYAR